MNFASYFKGAREGRVDYQNALDDQERQRDRDQKETRWVDEMVNAYDNRKIADIVANVSQAQQNMTRDGISPYDMVTSNMELIKSNPDFAGLSAAGQNKLLKQVGSKYAEIVNTLIDQGEIEQANKVAAAAGLIPPASNREVAITQADTAGLVNAAQNAGVNMTFNQDTGGIVLNGKEYDAQLVAQAVRTANGDYTVAIKTLNDGMVDAAAREAQLDVSQIQILGQLRQLGAVLDADGNAVDANGNIIVPASTMKSRGLDGLLKPAQQPFSFTDDWKDGMPPVGGAIDSPEKEAEARAALDGAPLDQAGAAIANSLSPSLDDETAPQEIQNFDPDKYALGKEMMDDLTSVAVWRMQNIFTKGGANDRLNIEEIAKLDNVIKAVHSGEIQLSPSRMQELVLRASQVRSAHANDIMRKQKKLIHNDVAQGRATAQTFNDFTADDYAKLTLASIDSKQEKAGLKNKINSIALYLEDLQLQLEVPFVRKEDHQAALQHVMTTSETLQNLRTAYERAPNVK